MASRFYNTVTLTKGRYKKNEKSVKQKRKEASSFPLISKLSILFPSDVASIFRRADRDDATDGRNRLRSAGIRTDRTAQMSNRKIQVATKGLRETLGCKMPNIRLKTSGCKCFTPASADAVRPQGHWPQAAALRREAS